MVKKIKPCLSLSTITVYAVSEMTVNYSSWLFFFFFLIQGLDGLSVSHIVE